MKYIKKRWISNHFVQVATQEDDEEEYVFEPILEK
jgi:hypothetical protein